MALYPYETQLVLDAASSDVVVRDAYVTIFDAADTGMVTPLQLVDVSGAPLANPLRVTPQGFIPAFQATAPQVLWSGGGYYGYLSSYRGLLNETIAARNEASNSALNALNAKAAAEAAAASAVAPTDASVDAGIVRAGAVAAWKSTVGYAAGQYAVNPSGVLVKASTNIAAGGSYNPAQWIGGAASSAGATNYVVQNATTGVIPARPTADPAVLVFWVCWTQPPRVTSGTGGAYPNDIWLQRSAP